MNIDIREYLRIKPISVHELTLSDNPLDCFLTFSTSVDSYNACTQQEMIWELVQSIFPDILEGDKFSFKFCMADDTLLSDSMLVDYARKSRVEQFILELDQLIAGLRSEVDVKLTEFDEDVVLDYLGAVELQSCNLGSKGRDLYYDFSYVKDFLWCGVQMEEMDNYGSDEVEIANIPQHVHPDVRAETFTGPLATNRGGGDLVGGRIGMGNQSRIALSKSLGRENESVFRPMIEDWTKHQGNMTYPLWGQNMFDFRYPHRGHNNIPPSLNIFVRLLNECPSSSSSLLSGRVAGVVDNEWIDWDNDGEREIDSGGVAVPIFDPDAVWMMPDYNATHYTEKDCLLRIVVKEGKEPDIRKQTVASLLEIISSKINQQTTKDGLPSMAEQLKPLFERSLFHAEKWEQWKFDAVKALRDIAGDLDNIRENLRSQKPSTYVGRIIVSTKDDTERKVIQHYGGKKWKRHMNFLRGVEDSDPAIGRKQGETYVELRQSSVPIHTHNVKLYDNTPSNDVSWIAKDAGGEQVYMVARAAGVEEVNDAVGLGNSLMEYHISPIDYDDSPITIPHDNMPPYREVYVWECLETESEPEQWRIRYDLGAAKDDATAKLAEGTLWTYDKSMCGTYAPDYPESEEWSFVGWTPSRIPEDSSGDITFTASWERNENTYSITYKNFPEDQGAEYEGDGYKKSYTPLDSDYIPPIPPRQDGWQFVEWTPQMIQKGSEGNVTFTASWAKVNEGEPYQPGIIWRTVVFKYSNGDTVCVKRLKNGETIGVPPRPESKSGHVFQGWMDEQSRTIVEENNIKNMSAWRNYVFSSVMQVERYKIQYNTEYGHVPYDALTEYTVDDLPYTLPILENAGEWRFVAWFTHTPSVRKNEITVEDLGNIELDASWEKVSMFTSTFMDGWSGQILDTTFSAAGDYLKIPDGQPEREGYNFTGWWTAPDGGHQVDINSKVTQDATYYAHWMIRNYQISYNINNDDAALPDGLKHSYTIADAEYAPPSPENPYGYEFNGWSPPSTQGLTKDITFTASWKAVKFTITFVQMNGRDNILVEQEYKSIILPPQTPVKYQYVFLGWYTEPEGGDRIGGYDDTVTGDMTFYAHWEKAAITNLNFVKCAYDEDFVAKNDGWEEKHHANHHRIAALKWVGSTYRSDWIAYQPGPGLATICSRLCEDTNTGNRYLYRPGSSEMAYQTLSDPAKLTPLKDTTYVGVGGTAITSITPKRKNGILIDKIVFSPYASNKCQYSSYSSSNSIVKQDKDSDGKYGSFRAELTGLGPSHCLLSVGNVFKAVMTLSDKTKIVKKVEGSSLGKTETWHTVDSVVEKETLEFDFSEELVGKPKDIRTEQITFETSGVGKDVFKLLLVNGLEVYKNTRDI